MGKVLVIDDDDVFRNLLKTAVASKGHDVQTLSDGDMLDIDMLDDEKFDLIITDMVMPGRHGYDTIQEIRKYYPKLKILAVSAGLGGDKKNVLEVAKMMGANQALEKPFTMNQLNECLAALGL